METGAGRKSKKDERRMSSGYLSATAALSKEAGDNKRPLITVLSQDHLSADKCAVSSNSSAQRQSFLSRFVPNNEAKNVALDMSMTQNASQLMTEHQPHDQQQQQQATISPSVFPPETECDKLKSVATTSTKSKNDDLDQNRNISLGHSCLSSKREPTMVTKQTQKSNTSDDDQVLPTWPSRIEAVALEPASVQHQVYSLKDYSQVAGPTKTIASTSTGRLLKSMSQDRKVKANTKRMSECIYSNTTQHSIYAGTNDSTSSIPSGAGPKQRNPSIIEQMSSAGYSMGPATSVNSLLPASSTKNTTLLSESRIDRMRKLFVSPLSLRSSASGAAGANKTTATSSHSGNPRLSFQSGANMLNKPHHLMHAMYRTRTGVAHHSRRSPMRQKQGGKSFRVYGCPLHMANNIYPITCFGRPDIYKQQSVPYVLARLCNYIEENSSQLTHEGIFRVSGNARLMEKLRTLFDRLGDAPLESESVDVATSASMLKMYLRELPEPLIPTRMNYYFITLAKKYSTLLSKDNLSDFKAFDNVINPVASKSCEPSSAVISGENQTVTDRQRMAYLRDLTKLVRKLPIENYNLLKYLACFLYRISLKQQYNKMCAEALGIVFGPNVFRIRSESYKGLKEQELSNQIMASIISNYKSIFDCELTDPLGNLVKSNEDLKEKEDSSKRSPREVANQSLVDGVDKAQKSTATRTTTGGSSSSPVPSTSVTCASGETKNCIQVSCPRHDYVRFYHDDDKLIEPSAAGDRRSCQVEGRRYDGLDESEGDDEDENEDEDEDEVEDDDEDDDEEDCDDESYSPSSGSSYCSTMDSDTVESTYDDDGPVEGDQYDDENFGVASRSSSECGSDTNYTPSSSHSDSDPNDGDESLYYKSSSFDSSSSLGHLKATNTEGSTSETKLNQMPVDQTGCRVCKRRESAQIETIASKLSEKDHQRVSARVGIVHRSNDRLDRSNGDSSSAQKMLPNQRTERGEPRTKAGSGGSQHSQIVRSHSRCSQQKRSDKAKTVAESVRPELAGKTSSDIALDQRLGSATVVTKSRDDRLGARHYRHNLNRRRSSSASSLLRIKSKSSQLVGKKSVSKDEQQQQHHHHHRAKLGYSDKRKVHDFRGYSRRSRNKSHLMRKSEHSSSTKARRSTGWHQRPEKIGHYGGRELSKLSKNFVWDFISASYLGIPECEQTLQLRSYNSDETLLRSSVYDAQLSRQMIESKTRRFSDYESVQTDRINVIPSVCQTFGQIYEALENEVAGGGDIDTVGGFRFEQTSDQGQSTTMQVGTSIISLLDYRLTNFKHSVLFINDCAHEDAKDPILNQLKAMKDLIRVLKRQLKYGSAYGFTDEVANFILKHLNSRDYLDTICYIDYLSAKFIIETFEKLTIDSDKSSTRVDQVKQEKASKLLNEKISSLKERHDNLKTLRNHYIKYHATNSSNATTPKAMDSNQKRKFHGSLDTLQNERQQQVSTSDNCCPKDKESRSNGKELLSCVNNSDSELSNSTGSSLVTLATKPNELELESVSPKVGLDPARIGANEGEDEEERLFKCQRSCKFGSLCPVEFVYNMEKQLAIKRIVGTRLIQLNEMSSDQLRSEKLELQKNLLRYEHWFGRPTTRLDFNLVGHLYDRYRAIKMIKQRKRSQEQ